MYHIGGGEPYKHLHFWLSRGVRCENSYIYSWRAINDEI